MSPKPPVRAFVEKHSWLPNVKKVNVLLVNFNINTLIK